MASMTSLFYQNICVFCLRGTNVVTLWPHPYDLPVASKNTTMSTATNANTLITAKGGWSPCHKVSGFSLDTHTAAQSTSQLHAAGVFKFVSPENNAAPLLTLKTPKDQCTWQQDYQPWLYTLVKFPCEVHFVCHFPYIILTCWHLVISSKIVRA